MFMFFVTHFMFFVDNFIRNAKYRLISQAILWMRGEMNLFFYKIFSYQKLLDVFVLQIVNFFPIRIQKVLVRILGLSCLLVL